MPARIGTPEPTTHRHYDEGWFRHGVDYATDNSIDEAYGVLDAGRRADGKIDTQELMKFIVSGYDYAQYTDREARQIANAIRVNWDALTPEAKALGVRFIEEMRPRVRNIDDCSPYALGGRPRDNIFMPRPNDGAPDGVAIDGVDMSQLLGQLAGMTGTDID